jgi:hypothetical protein
MMTLLRLCLLFLTSACASAQSLSVLPDSARADLHDGVSLTMARSMAVDSAKPPSVMPRRNDLAAVMLRKAIASGRVVALDAPPPDSSIRTSMPPPFAGYNPNRTDVKWGRFAIVTGALGATITAIHLYQMNAWWKDERGPFHFVDDNTYALNVDKAGHFLGGAVCSYVAIRSLEWSGFSHTASVFTGGALGALFELYIEFEDGFATNWGFSPGDAYGDILGAAWTVGQETVPYMENFQPKFSYWPSKAMREGNTNRIAMDDYDGQTAWMGVHVYGLLPCAWRRYWPSWLGFAVGVSVRGVDGPQESKQRNILIALDYDLTKIIPTDTWLLSSLARWMNFVHLPAPAIRISPGYIAYGLYF